MQLPFLGKTTIFSKYRENKGDTKWHEWIGNSEYPYVTITATDGTHIRFPKIDIHINEDNNCNKSNRHSIVHSLLKRSIEELWLSSSVYVNTDVCMRYATLNRRAIGGS